jgi:DNA-binding CsgD family transcriptional regulator
MTESGRVEIEAATTDGLSWLMSAQSMQRRGIGKTPLVVIDDAHLLDPGSAHLLLELARARRARFLITATAGTVLPVAILAMWKDEHIERIDLDSLNDHEMRRLASALFDGALGHVAAVRLAKLADGNPMLLRELAHAAVDQGALVLRSGIWTLGQEILLSHRLRELLGWQVDKLSVGARDALRLVALGEPLRLLLVEQEFGNDVVAELERSALIRILPCERGGPASASGLEVRLAQPIIGEHVRHTVGVLDRRRLTHRLVDMHNQAPTGQVNERLRVLGWQSDSGLPIDESTLLDASWAAYVAHDFVAAARFASSAWSAHRTHAAGVQYAIVLFAAGQYADAYLVLDSLADGSTVETATVSTARARGYILEGRLDEAQSLLDQVRSEEASLCRAMIAYFSGKFALCYSLVSRVMESANLALKVEAGVFGMAALCHMGRPADALELSGRIRPADSDPSADRWIPVHLDSISELVAAAQADLGDLAAATETLTCDFDRSFAGGASRVDAQRGLALGFVLLERGRPREALKMFQFGPSYTVGWELWQQRSIVNSLLAGMLVLESEEVDDIAARLPPVSETFFAGYHLIARAWHAHSKSDQTLTKDLLVRAASTAKRNEGYADVAIAVHEMGRLGVAEAARPFWSVGVQGPFLQARLDYTRSLVTRNTALLRNAAEAFSDAGANLYAAEAFAELSLLFRREEQDRAATEALRRARSLVEQCEGAVSPPMSLIGTVVPLSKREREVAVLAARGFDDRTIAEKLTLSVRTVGNHLYRVYFKLGLTNRRQLRDALRSGS